MDTDYEVRPAKVFCINCGSKDVIKIMDPVVGWTGHYACNACGGMMVSNCAGDNPYYRRAHQIIKELGVEGLDANRIAMVTSQMIRESEYLVRKEARLQEQNEYISALDRQMDRYEAASLAAHDQQANGILSGKLTINLGGKSVKTNINGSAKARNGQENDSSIKESV